MRAILALCLVVSLTSCTAAYQIEQGVDPQTAITDAVVADLRGALASAEAFDDAAGVQCWSGLLQVAERVNSHRTEVIGPATAWQKARNIRRVAGEAADTFEEACGGLYLTAPGPVRRVIDVVLRVRDVAGLL